MSDEESQFECSDEEKRDKHLEEKYKKASFTPERIQSGETLLEIVKKAFRSSAVSNASRVH